MSDEKALEKIGNKYLCMTSGQKRMEPCDGCSNPKGCLSRAMQYKETEEMDQQEEKAVLKVSADGDVVSCAKGMDAKECGYKGGKVCGACGAMAVSSKDADDVEEVESTSEIDEKAMDGDKTPKLPMGDMADDEEDEEESEDVEDMEEDEKGMGYAKKPMKKKAAPKKAMMAEGDMPEEDMPEEDEEDEEDEESDGGEMAMKKKAMVEVEIEDEEDEEDEEEEEDAEPQGNAMMPTMEGRRRAIKRVAGKKSDDIDLDDSYICQFERKAYPTEREVCANCPGGCVAEQGMPGIADVEGMALDMFGGKVLASGYTGTDEDQFGNLFVVDIMSKDGHAIEIIADGDTGEMLNFHRLQTENISAEFGKKSLEDAETASGTPRYIDIKTAQEIALGVIELEVDTKGEVLQADTDIFEGYDSWVFEIDAVNGKSYDVFVALDGHVLGYDEYDAEEAADIEAEAAELALKRAYSDDQRESMAKEGEALSDGSYPIKDVADLRNAITAYGRAKDKEKAKAHIIKRAMDLGEEDLIPENWVPKKIQDQAKRDEEKSDESDEQARLMKDLMEFQMLAAEQDLDGLI